MNTITFSRARSNLKAVLDRVVDDSDVTIIKRRDASDAVVMSLDTFNAWRETTNLFSSANNARRLAKSLAELRSGKARARALVDLGGATPRAPRRRQRRASAR